MVQSENTPSDDDPNDETPDEQILASHYSIPEQLRERILKRDGRCQICGRPEPSTATGRLVVQKLHDNPAWCDPLDEENLEARCLRCCRWIAEMPTSDDLPLAITERLADADIEATWAEILQYLNESGPATTGEITDAVSLNSKPGVRNALYSLMSLDVREESVTDRIVVKDRVDRTYGLPWQIPEEHYARGTIPLRPSNRRSRILDEIVRRLIETLPDDLEDKRGLIANVVDRKPHQTREMNRRAQAFDFAFSEWADTSQPEQSGAAVIEAVAALAGSTDNLSRQLLSRQIADLFESNDEQDLGALLREWAHGDLSSDDDTDSDDHTDLGSYSTTCNKADSGRAPEETKEDRSELSQSSSRIDEVIEWSSDDEGTFDPDQVSTDHIQWANSSAPRQPDDNE